MRLVYLLVILSSFGLTACSRRLTQVEVQAMARMNEGWRDDIRKMSTVIQASSVKYAETHSASVDSATASNQAHEKAAFLRWFTIALSGVNRLQMLVQTNADWIVRLLPGKMPAAKVQRAWDASRMVFYENHATAMVAIDAYPGISKNWKPNPTAPPATIPAPAIP